MLGPSMSSPPILPLPPSGQLLAKAGLPRRVLDALETTIELVEERISAPLARSLPGLADQVSALGDFGAHHRVTIDVVDAPKRLLRDGEAMTRLFLDRIEQELAALRDPPRPGTTVSTPSAPAAAPSFDQLRLVDEDDDNAAVIIGAVALRHESRSALPIQLLCQRFAVLAASPAYEPGTLPLGPRRLSELLVEAGTMAGFGPPLIAAVLRHFDRHVLSMYEDFAETLNGLLSNCGVMPGLAYVPLRQRARRTGEPKDGPGEETGRTQATAGESPRAARPADAIARGGMHLWEGDTLEGGVDYSTLQGMLAARRGLAERFRRVGPDAATRPALDTGTALDLLARRDAAAASSDFASIRQWLLLQARQQRGEAVALPGPQADAFELLDLLYAHVAEDVRPETPAARMMGQLRLPLARLALKNHEFLVQPGNPARQLLDVVAESGAAWQAPDDVDPQFLQHLQHAVDTVQRDVGDPEATFAAALDAVETQRQVVARRAEMAERRSVEAARGKDRLAVARRRASEVIAGAMVGLELPVFHRNMLRQAWADVLTLAHLRHGEEAEEWIALVGETRDLALSGANRVATSEAVTSQVEQALATVGHHGEDAARIARILTSSQANEADDAASRTELAMRLKSRARLGEELGAPAALLPPRTAEEDVAYRRLRTLSFGTWMTFIAEDGSMTRRRLAWWSPTTDSMLFVNQRGQRVAESTLDAVARDMVAGRARIVRDDEGGLIDRAWRGVVRSLRSFAAREDAPKGVAR